MFFVVPEDAKEGRLPVMLAEPAEEHWICCEAPPLLADCGGTREGGRLRRKAEKDLPEEIVIIQHGAAAAAADHVGALALAHGGGTYVERRSKTLPRSGAKRKLGWISSSFGG